MELGALIGLAGIDNWDSIRAAKARDLQLISMQEALAQKGMEEQMAANQKIAEYQNTLAEVSSKLLPPDVERLKGEEERLRDELKKKAKKGLMEAGGDTKKWLASGGLNELDKYRKGLLMGDATQTGLHNSFAHAQAIADQKAGKIWRPILTKGAKGEDIELEYGDQLKQFQDGTIKNITYAGSYERPDFSGLRTMFSNVEGKNPYQPQSVDPYTFENAALYMAKEKGLNNMDAVHAAKRATADYIEMQKAGGQPFQFKTRQYYQPSSASYGAAKDVDNALYFGEQLGNIGTGNPEAFQKKSMVGVSLGKFPFTEEVVSTTKDADGKKTTTTTKPTTEKENQIEDYIIDDNGNVLIATTETLSNKGGTVDGQKVDANGYAKFTDGIITRIAKANGISFKAVRDTYNKAKAYGGKLPNSEKLVTKGKIDYSKYPKSSDGKWYYDGKAWVAIK